LKIILYIVLAFTLNFASTLQEDIWWKGETLLTFFDKHQISKDIYFNLSKTDKELCSEIYAGVEYQMMLDKDHKLEQVLIPISEEMQIHIYKDTDKRFTLDIIPIEYQEITQSISIPIQNSPYQDIVENTGNHALANEFIIAFKKSVNFKRLRKDDLVSIVYTQKIRSGRYFGTPDILGASVQMRKKVSYIFENPVDKRYYNENAKGLTNFLLSMPVRYTRISSRFTHKRFHPILKRYRAHLGLDLAAPRGRRVNAAADGKIILKRRKGGYGKTVMIRHKNGLKTLYGHLSSYSRKIHVGSYVKQGQFIARVGTTGRSTGPHLHFGLYKNGRAINPLTTIRITKSKLSGKQKRDFMKVVKSIKKEFKESINKKIMKIEKFELSYQI
jgi:murein DD-endopeptidase MepM/ murein hydrolase activator NlpD